MGIDIRFSTQNTGACPICKKLDGCKILSHIEEAIVNSDVSLQNDNKMDVVIYRCPEFIEEER